MASSRIPLKLVEVRHIHPSSSNSQDAELSLPLTFFDVYWLKFHPVERLFYYKFPDLTTQSFLESIYPNLKHSLSTTLSHFLPLAGTITWPDQDSKPFLHYTPGDSVKFTVAESCSVADQFEILSGDDAQEVIGCRSLVPELHVTETEASCIALQVTVFPSKGLCIGISTHHAVLDGKSSTSFVKAWAQICKEYSLKGKDVMVSLTQELIPFMNREVIKDPTGIDSIFLDYWVKMSKVYDPNSNPRSLKLAVHYTESPESLVRRTFRLTKKDISTLKNQLYSRQEKIGKEKHSLSTFCMTCAHVLVCMLRAIEFKNIKRAFFVFTADFRARLDPPIPTNYIGNCVWGGIVEMKNEYCVNEDGMAIVAEMINDAVKDIGVKDLERAKEWISKIGELMEKGNRVIGVAGSPRFEVYKTDYGWGNPKKVEIVSVDRNGSIAMAENSDESGGIEVGIVLNKAQMEVFASEFHRDLGDSS